VDERTLCIRENMTSDMIENYSMQLRLLEDIPAPYAVFRVLFDSTRKRVVNTRYVYVSDAYCQLAEHLREELIGHDFLELYPSGHGWFPYCQQVLAERRTVHACFYSEEAKHWLDFTAGPASEPDTVAFVFTNVDESILKSQRERNTDNIILLISKLLNNGEDFEACMNHALKQLSAFIHPDRLYVLETDGKTVSNTYEWCAEGVTPEI
jgi:hypothetical protein